MCLDFINTQWYTKHKPFKEYLEDPLWMDGFCSKWGIPKIIVSRDTVRTFKAVRSDLLVMARQLAVTKTISRESIAKLNGYLGRGMFRHLLEGEKGLFRIERIPQVTDQDWIIYNIAYSLADLISNYPSEYLRECGNPDCDWIFYDSSKSHTRKWCDNRCATLMKVRKYRAGRGKKLKHET